MFSDNESLTKNVSRIEFNLNKKNSSIAYHLTRWAVVADETTVSFVKGTGNITDALNKLFSETARNDFFGDWIY